jgi:hypothetical protein
MVANKTYEKVSFNLPTDIKLEVVKLKNSMKVSLNTIYKTAIVEYIERQEIKRWEKGIELASKNKEYLKLCSELGEIGGELYEY